MMRPQGSRDSRLRDVAFIRNKRAFRTDLIIITCILSSRGQQEKITKKQRPPGLAPKKSRSGITDDFTTKKKAQKITAVANTGRETPGLEAWVDQKQKGKKKTSVL